MSKTPEQLQLVKKWLSLAEENYQFAQMGVGQDFSPVSTVCSLCQQSAEKYLKAYLLYKGWSLKKTHDLKQLLQYADRYDSGLFAQLDSAATLLNDYITIGRYPDEMPGNALSTKEARDAISAAGMIRTLVKGKLAGI